MDTPTVTLADGGASPAPPPSAVPLASKAHAPAPAPGEAELDLSVLVPVYNEAEGVGPTLDRLLKVLRARHGLHWEVVLVNDGSTDATADVLAAYGREKNVSLYHNAANRGYGATLKFAARRARGQVVAIIDADGTYAPEEIPRLARAVAEGMADMAVGARTGQSVHVPLARRPAKWFLRRLAEFLSGHGIPDLNSGLRALPRDLMLKHAKLLPDGFSLTTTLTLALATSGYKVEYFPIDYARRAGKSSIRPIRDTAKFFGLIVRSVTHFNPLRVFGPLSTLLMLGGVATAFVSKFVYGQLMDVTSVTLVLGGVQLLGIGLIADMIAKRT